MTKFNFFYCFLICGDLIGSFVIKTRQFLTEIRINLVVINDSQSAMLDIQLPNHKVVIFNPFLCDKHATIFVKILKRIRDSMSKILHTLMRLD